MRCARCDHELPAYDRFCGRCGLSRPVDGQAVDPLVGLTLAGRYRIEHRIGVGGMGTVYLGSHVDLGQRVAVKVLHERFARDPALSQRFENEARTYGRLSHPNLVTLHDFGRTPDGTLYTVLEYCPGSALCALVRERGALSPRLAADIVTQMAQGLTAAHQAGVIHRDLKPDNVMLVESRPGRYHVKLLDFGIAKCLHDENPGLTQAGMVFGTPEYMSPEQARGETVDARADVYALGCILYELLTGRPPFTGANKMNVMHRQASEAPVPPSMVVPGETVPVELEAVVLRCLAKPPVDRFPDTPSLIEAIDEAVGHPRPEAPPLPTARPPAVATEHAGERISRPSEGWSVPPERFRGGSPRTGAALAALLFMGAVGSAAWLWSARPEEKPAPVAVAPGPAPRPAPPPPAPASQVAPRPAPRPAPAPAPASEPVPKRAVEEPAPTPPARAERPKPAPSPGEPRPAPDKGRATNLAEARRALRLGDLDETARRIEKALRGAPADREALELKSTLAEIRAAVDRGRSAFDRADCVEALAALEPVLEVAPGTRGVNHIVSSCREALPPRQL